MANGDFDFGSLVNDQFKGIRHGYKFGKAFNERKECQVPMMEYR